MEKCDIVTVTGTKGKTTVTTIVEGVLRSLTKKDTILVTTVGHYVNGEQKSDLEDSKRVWGLVPSNAPGRYLFEALSFENRGIAVLEASLGSSSINGMGYSWHEVGVFLNVFKDHIGSSSRLKTQEDIVRAKKFVFERIRDEGYAIYNADDRYVCSALQYVREGVTRISFGAEDAEAASDRHVFVREEAVWYREPAGERRIVSLQDVIWTFGGAFTPSVYNLMAAVGAIVGHFKGVVPDGLAGALAASRLDPYGGRLTLLQNEAGVRILADYAHEEESLRSVGRLARLMAGETGRTIAVVRLAYDRTDEHIRETGYGIADSFDHFVVYDKIDGHHRKPKEKLQSKRFVQEVGLVSSKLAAALEEKGAAVDRVIREDEALQHAASIAHPGDVVVFIVNDDIPQSIDWARSIFEADFG